MRIAITCRQLVRDLDDVRAATEEAGFEIRVPEIRGQHLEGDALVEAVEGCAGVVAGDDPFTAAVLVRLPALRVISKWGIGVDGIDFEAAAARGITVTNTPGAFDDEVADVAMAYTIMLLRRLGAVHEGVRRGEWPKPAGRSARGLRMGIIGLGGIGRALARRAAAAGMETIGTDPAPESRAAAEAAGTALVPLDALLSASDVVSLHCPLTARYAPPSERSPPRRHEAGRLRREHRPRRPDRHHRAGRGVAFGPAGRRRPGRVRG